MKKNLFYLLALSCSMSLLIACSDDKNDNWKKVSGQVITAGNLSLETNIPASSDASVKLTMTNAQNGVLTLNKVVKGTDEVAIDVTVAEQTGGTFKFQGGKSIQPATKTAWQLLSSTDVQVSGTITLDGKAAVAVSTKASGDMVKKFLLCDFIYHVAPGDMINVYAPLRLSWVSSYGVVDGSEPGTNNISTVGTSVLSAVMTKLLKAVEFKADGSIVADYAEEPNITLAQMIAAGNGVLLPTDGIIWKTSPANLAYWYLKGKHIYVVLNIPAIVAEYMKGQKDPKISPEAVMQVLETIKGMDGASLKAYLGKLLGSLEGNSLLGKLDLSKIADSDIEKLVSYLNEGFPLSYKTTSQLEIGDNRNNGEVAKTVNDLSIYLDKDFFDIFMPAIYPILPDVDALLKNMKIPMVDREVPIWDWINMRTGLNSVTEVEDIWKVTTHFSLGTNLGDGSYKPVK